MQYINDNNFINGNIKKIRGNYCDISIIYLN